MLAGQARVEILPGDGFFRITKMTHNHLVHFSRDFEIWKTRGQEAEMIMKNNLDNGCERRQVPTCIPSYRSVAALMHTV